MMRNISDNLYTSYCDICKEAQVEPNHSIVNILERLQLQATNQEGIDRQNEDGVVVNAEGLCKRFWPSLDLSTHSLPVQHLHILFQALATDHTVKELLLADCVIPEMAIHTLADVLCTNRSILYLNMKGNNIKGSTAEALSKILRSNSTIIRLAVEWNNLGILEDSFAVFCEGLGTNKSVQSVDLRNNQISQIGANELATVLRRNSTIKYLDLRWNNLGCSGGERLLQGVNKNRNLVILDVAGNNIPADIIMAINSRVECNVDRKASQEDCNLKTQILYDKIQTTQLTHSEQVEDLLKKLDEQQAAFSQASQQTNNKVLQLQDALEDRKLAFQALNDKMSKSERALKYSESKVEQYAMMLEEGKKLRVNMEISHRQQLEKIEQDILENESKLNLELKATSSKCDQLTDELCKSESKCSEYKSTVSKLEDEMSCLRHEMNRKSTAAQEQIELQQLKALENRKLWEEDKCKEMDRIRRDAEDRKQELRDQLERCENGRRQLEHELSEMRSKLKAEKQHFDEELADTKMQLKSDHEHKYLALADKYKLMESSRAELRDTVSTLSASVTALTNDNNKHKLQQDASSTSLQHAQQEVDSKQAELERLVKAHRKVLSEERSKLESAMERADGAEKRLETQKERSREERETNTELIKGKDREVKLCRERVAAVEEEMGGMRAAERDRANLLKSFVLNHVNQSTAATADHQHDHSH